VGTVQGDLIRGIDRQEYLDEEVLNIYFYRYAPVAPATNDVYDVLADFFENNLIPAVAATQADLLTHTNINIVNLSNGIDFLDRPITIRGDLATTSSEALPSYVSIGYMLIRESLVTRNGYKRFAGLPEYVVQGNEYSISSTLTDAIEDQLSTDVFSGLTVIYEPVIVKHPIGSPPVASYQYSSIGDAQLRKLGTQNTRKPDA